MVSRTPHALSCCTARWGSNLREGEKRGKKEEERREEEEDEGGREGEKEKSQRWQIAVIKNHNEPQNDSCEIHGQIYR